MRKLTKKEMLAVSGGNHCPPYDPYDSNWMCYPEPDPPPPPPGPGWPPCTDDYGNPC